MKLFLIFNNPCKTDLVEPSLIVWTRIMLSIFWSICSILYSSLCYVKYCVTQDLVHCLTHAYEPDKILLFKGWWHQIACIFLMKMLYDLKLSTHSARLDRTAAVSCSPTGPWIGGIKMGSGMTGKLGRAWHLCMCGAWHGAWLFIGGCLILGGTLK